MYKLSSFGLRRSALVVVLKILVLLSYLAAQIGFRAVFDRILPEQNLTTKEDEDEMTYSSLSSITAHLKNDSTLIERQGQSLEQTPEDTRCRKRLPQVIIAGHFKSGTAALRDFLKEHPQVATSSTADEDVNFFTRYYESRGFTWYRKIMPCTYANQTTIEKTAHYFHNLYAGSRIFNMSSKTKIMIIVKDPISIATSLYAMLRAHKQREADVLSFVDMVTLSNGSSPQIDPESYIIKECTHGTHMQRWLELFDRKQLLILDGNIFGKHPAKELQKVETFLNLEPFFEENKFVFNTTKGQYCFRRDSGKLFCLPEGKGRPHPIVSDEIKNVLRQYFEPINKQFFEMINETFTW